MICYINTGLQHYDWREDAPSQSSGQEQFGLLHQVQCQSVELVSGGLTRQQAFLWGNYCEVVNVRLSLGQKTTAQGFFYNPIYRQYFLLWRLWYQDKDFITESVHVRLTSLIGRVSLLIGWQDSRLYNYIISNNNEWPKSSEKQL